MKNIGSYLLGTLLLFACGITGCKSDSFDKRTENLNKGELSIYADNSYRTIVTELVRSYENVYPESKIHITFADDRALLEALLADKTRMVITGRTFSPAEIAAIEKVNTIPVEQFGIATEAIAIIMSKDRTDTVFDLDEFYRNRESGYQGKYMQTRFVFNQANEGIISELTGGNARADANMFSMDNTDTLINYIAATKNAFGFISFAEVSDTDDPAVKAILEKINVAYVGKTDSTGKYSLYALSQSTIADHTYPLQRQVTVLKGNIPELLGTGFVNFMYRSKASRILLKAGLIPVKMPERLINIPE